MNPIHDIDTGALALDDWHRHLLDVEHGLGGRLRVIDGPLHHFASVAEEREWIVGFLSGRPGSNLRQLLSEAFDLPLANMARPTRSRLEDAALRSYQSFVAPALSPSVLDIRPAVDEAGGEVDRFDAQLAGFMLDLAKAAATNGVGVALLVEGSEYIPQSNLESLRTMASTAERGGWPVLVLISGNPGPTRQS
ncbi:hypothetical protein IGS73_14695 [Janibacter indicus]|uniref:Uncharacterized protein n=1 Tax=Janibacter indicus TaxID=857417 RepID=A0A7L9IYW7_9MICO|nr:hypothetical protein [Janibacter indicus]QOK22319.1 hypothetical protein IGS73_14695 [Janibacter indicus]